MKHTFEQKVYYSDTDAYGVVWHGSYLRWLEMGRVEYCEDLGLNLIELEKQDIVMPVTNMNIRYKANANIICYILNCNRKYICISIKSLKQQCLLIILI